MTRERLEELLDRIPTMRIAVLGDFFLDRYLVIDPALAERSIETGLEARQVVDVRCSPGAAGTVTSNLAALGVRSLEAIGVIGDDGEGYELVRGLRRTGVDTAPLAHAAARFTPTYTKPMLRTASGEREMERLDTKNRAPLDADLEERLAAAVAQRVAERRVDAIVVMDQVEERNCGAVTDRVRAVLADLGRRVPGVLIFADSRRRIGEYRNAVTKPNHHEAARALGRHPSTAETPEGAGACGRPLATLCGRPVFVTMGAAGIMVCDAERATRVPSVPVPDPIDIVGAGDSATAGIVCGLCAGATPEEAALLGNLCAAVTIRKLGTTGTASPDEVRRTAAALT